MCAASELDAIVCGYVETALGLGERDPDSLDFSIAPSFVADAVHRSYPTLEQLAATTQSLQAQAKTLAPDTASARRRVDALRPQLNAVATRIGMLRGQVLPFDAEGKALFATERLPDHETAARKSVRAEIARSLAELPMSEKGTGPRPLTLADRYAIYDRQFFVPPDRLARVMNAALTACREQTLKHLSLPAAEEVELVFVRNQPWSAFSRYKGRGRSTISINLDLPITVDQALELACHEGYPGHHVFNTLREQALVVKQHLPEAEVQLTFSPQSYVSEAAAAFAPELALSEDDRFRIEHDRLFPLAGLSAQRARQYVHICSLVRLLNSAEPEIAQEYLDGQLEFVRAEQLLADAVLMAHGEASLLYLNEYRSYMLAYTDGPRRMREFLDSGPYPSSELMWHRFVDLTTHFAVQLK